MPTVTLEAIAESSLWIWHECFGIPRSFNDINVLETSALINKITAGKFSPAAEYEINNVRRNKPAWELIEFILSVLYFFRRSQFQVEGSKSVSKHNRGQEERT